MRQPGVLVLASLALFTPALALSQEIVHDTQVTMKARVLEVLAQEERVIPGTDIRATYQTIRIRVIDEPEAGRELTLENDYLNLGAGDVFYLTHYSNSFDGTDYYAVSEPYRLPQLALLTLLFIGVVLYFGGRQGLRGLLCAHRLFRLHRLSPLARHSCGLSADRRCGRRLVPHRHSGFVCDARFQ